MAAWSIVLNNWSQKGNTIQVLMWIMLLRLHLFPDEVKISLLKFEYHCFKEHSLNIKQIFGVCQRGISQGGGFEEELREKNVLLVTDDFIVLGIWFRGIDETESLYHKRNTWYSFPALHKDCKRNLLKHCLEEIPTQCIHWEQYWLVSTKLCHFSVGISNLRNISFTNVSLFRCRWHCPCSSQAGDYFTCHPLCDPHLNFLRNHSQPPVPCFLILHD